MSFLLGRGAESAPLPHGVQRDMKTTLLLLLALACSTGALADREIRAGANLDIDQPVSDDLFAAGAHVTLSAPVAGKARLTGGQVEIDAKGSAHDTVIAGGNVTVRGKIDGDLRASAGHVMLDSQVTGDATVNAGSLQLGPNARIDGKLKFRGESLERDPAAVVTGGVTQTTGRRHAWHHSPYGGFIGGAIVTLDLVILAALMAALLPGTSKRMQEELRAHPGLAPLMGFIALLCIPIAAVLAMVTVIGIPLGVLAILGYIALLMMSFVVTAVVVGGLVLERVKTGAAAMPGWRIGAAALAMLVIALLQRVPVIGGLVALAALLIGIGVIVGAIVHRAKPEAPAATPTPAF